MYSAKHYGNNDLNFECILFGHILSTTDSAFNFGVIRAPNLSCDEHCSNTVTVKLKFQFFISVLIFVVLH